MSDPAKHQPAPATVAENHQDEPARATAPLARAAKGNDGLGAALADWFRGTRKARNGDASVREAIEELIEERKEIEVPMDAEERNLLANILRLRDRTVEDVMVPSADIIGIAVDASVADAVAEITAKGHSRMPVFRETFDDVVGMLHIKDILSVAPDEPGTKLESLVRRVLFVAPSMGVLEALLEMRTSRVHMALVVDEYGGTDGLVTIEDLVEEIVGEIEDEHDIDREPQLVKCSDDQYDADARVELEVFEETVGPVFSAEEREVNDTLGGLVFSIAGRVPGRGEIVVHSSGIEFEVLDADPRRIRRLRVDVSGLLAANK